MIKHAEIVLEGLSIAPGIVLGVPAFFHSTVDQERAQESNHSFNYEQECARYRAAIAKTEVELLQMQEGLLLGDARDLEPLIETQRLLLKDPWISAGIEEEIGRGQKKAELVLRDGLKEYLEAFAKRVPASCGAKVGEVVDVVHRIISHLEDWESALESYTQETILIAPELLTSCALTAMQKGVKGFIADRGGKGSHAALIAKAKRLPFVSKIALHKIRAHHPTLILLDGDRGHVILNPTESTQEQYFAKPRVAVICRYEEKVCNLISPKIVQTLDGYQVELYANVDSIDDLEVVRHSGAAGIGLYRSEYLWAQTLGSEPSEDWQYEIYSRLACENLSARVVIRCFDFSGEKRLLKNVEGEGGIRFLLAQRSIFKAQLRALLRAASLGNIEILLPMVLEAQELIVTRQLIEICSNELSQEGVAHRSDLRLGCMIELPGSALTADLLLPHCDFLVVGTNDLIQFTTGVARDDLFVEERGSLHHTGVLRLLSQVVVEAKRWRTPLSLCGEIASPEEYLPLLLGIGLQAFSCPARDIALMRALIHKQSLTQAILLARQKLLLD